MAGDEPADPIGAYRQRGDVIGPTMLHIVAQRFKTPCHYHVTRKSSWPLRRKVNNRMKYQAALGKRGIIGESSVLTGPKHRRADTRTPQRKSLLPMAPQFLDEWFSILRHERNASSDKDELPMSARQRRTRLALSCGRRRWLRLADRTAALDRGAGTPLFHAARRTPLFRARKERP